MCVSECCDIARIRSDPHFFEFQEDANVNLAKYLWNAERKIFVICNYIIT